MLNIAVSGITGRIGKLVAELIEGSTDLCLVQRLARPELLLPAVEVLIDFSVAEAAVQYAKLCVDAKVCLVTGTTGLSTEQQIAMLAASKSTPIVQAANMSLGINILYALVAQAQKMLQGRYDVHIVEAHRKGKRDAPSGTALALKRVLQSVTPDQPIEIASIRAGELCEHQVWMVGENERLTLNHDASNRRVFAEGAIQAARWLKIQPPGLYSMQDVLSYTFPI